MRVLVAVEPPSLLRVIEHLFGGAPEIQIISRLHEALQLTKQAKRLQPDLIIVNARLLGESPCEVITALKTASPPSKLIVMGFDTGMACLARRCGVDVYMEEEVLVKQLLSAARQLAAQCRSHRDSRRASRAPRRTREN